MDIEKLKAELAELGITTEKELIDRAQTETIDISIFA